MATTLDTVMTFLQGKGLTRAQAAGVAGNWQVESSLNPASSNPKEGAVGLAQWEKGRRTALDNYAKATGGSETDLMTQLNYAWSEFQGPESGALQKLTATTTPQAAADVVDQYYERSAGTSRTTRENDAAQIFAGASTAGASPAGSSGGLVVQPAGAVSSTIAGAVLPIALKVGAGLTAAALLVVGVRETAKG